MKERIKREVKVTETIIESSSIEEVRALARKEKRSGNLIISYFNGGEVGLKFERIESISKETT